METLINDYLCFCDRKLINSGRHQVASCPKCNAEHIYECFEATTAFEDNDFILIEDKCRSCQRASSLNVWSKSNHN